ncbi:ADP-ribosylglycohydrolase [Sanghuangporus baumii]|uniref:ADP-ribosylhydrolase ARH3 n=1 Tax=Sanghuangporus baumii TaxID=108892 RepID=A0A9Q5I5K5_SANBA|nr:ADP-ribosylglycohydrolase [Sanghuangporus baumii]
MEPSATFVGKGCQPMPPGTWTDDTSTALCLAESLNENGVLIWEDVAKKLLSWYEMDICLLLVIASTLMCIDPRRLATAQLLGFFAGTESSSIDERKKQVLDPQYVPEGVNAEELNFVTQEAKALRAGTWNTKSANRIKTSGFVIHSHEAAPWALWNSTIFEEGMLLLLPLGFDVDTVCAIHGQLAGALYGIESIPDKWLHALQRKDILEKTFDTLVDRALLSSAKRRYGM